MNSFEVAGQLNGPTNEGFATRLAYVLLACAACIPFVLPYSGGLILHMARYMAAAVLWSLAISAMGLSGFAPGRWWRPGWPLLAALLLLAGCALGTWLWRRGPVGPTLQVLGVLLLAAAALLAGLWAGTGPTRHRWIVALAVGVLIAAACNVAAGVVQILAPESASPIWVATSRVGNRMGGNVDHPNLLSTFLVLALALLACLRAGGWLARAAYLALGLLLATTLGAASSRVGQFGACLLMLWALIDRRLQPWARTLLVLVPLVSFGAHLAVEFSIRPEGQPTTSSLVGRPAFRLAIWEDSLRLIAHAPWLGAGFDGYNRAWALSGAVQTRIGILSHAHNAPLHLAVEIGVPLAVAVTLLLGLALYRVLAAVKRAPLVHAALAVALVQVLFHSQVEFPLWHPHFLCLYAFVWGWLLAAPCEPLLARPGIRAASPGRWPFAIAGAAFCVASVFTTVDYVRASLVFSGDGTTAYRQQREQVARSSLLFSHYADLRSLQLMEVDAQRIEGAAAGLYSHTVMAALSDHLAKTGHEQLAVCVAEQLRHMRIERAKNYFDDCELAVAPERNHQCRTPQSPCGYWTDYEPFLTNGRVGAGVRHSTP